jgi:hypothetical protein
VRWPYVLVALLGVAVAAVMVYRRPAASRPAASHVPLVVAPRAPVAGGADDAAFYAEWEGSPTEGDTLRITDTTNMSVYACDAQRLPARIELPASSGRYVASAKNKQGTCASDRKKALRVGASEITCDDAPAPGKDYDSFPLSECAIISGGKTT